MPAGYTIKKSLFGKSKVQYKCPSCGADLESPFGDVGQQDDCPICARRLIVPGLEKLQAHREKEKAKQEQARRTEEVLARHKEAAAQAQSERKMQQDTAQPPEPSAWALLLKGLLNLLTDIRRTLSSGPRMDRLSGWGWLLTVGGLAIFFFFAFVYDTGVDVPSTTIPGMGTFGGGQVHNIGLQQNRQLGCIFGMLSAAVGAVMLAIDRNNRKPPSESS